MDYDTRYNLAKLEIAEATKIFESVKNQLINKKVKEKVMERTTTKL
ncbi:MAG: hypothetical protein ACUZ8E_12285 [Candidatus Anammoxibacter sp.]